MQHHGRNSCTCQGLDKQPPCMPEKVRRTASDALNCRSKQTGLLTQLPASRAACGRCAEPQRLSGEWVRGRAYCKACMHSPGVASPLRPLHLPAAPGIARHQEPVVVRRRAAGSSVRDTVLLLSLRYSRRRRRPDARGGAGGGGAGAGPRDAGQDPRQPGLGAGATTWWPSRSRPAPRCRWPGSRSARRSPARSCPSAAWPWSATACCCAARRAQRPAPIDRRRAPAVGGEPASGALLAAGRALRS